MKKTYFITTSIVALAVGIVVGKSYFASGTTPRNIIPDKNTLVECSTEIADSFDPGVSTLARTNWDASDLVYNQLMVIAGTEATVGKISLAESYEYLNNGLTLRIKLKPNVKFHTTPWFTPTRDLTSDDVVFSFMRALDKNHPYYNLSPSGYLSYEVLGFQGLIKEVKKVDDLTVDFVLKRKDATLIQSLGSGYTSILSAEYAEQLTKAGNQEQIMRLPVGTGAFVFVENKKNESNRYKRFDGFFASDVAPKFTNLVKLHVEDPKVMLKKMENNECLVAYVLNPQDKQSVIKNPNFDFIVGEDLTVIFNPIYNNQRLNKALRKALYHAWDRDAYNKILNSTARGLSITQGYSVLPKAQWGYIQLPSPEGYNKEKAIQLVKESGYDGRVLIQPFSSKGALRDALNQFMVEQYKAVGINVKFEYMTFPEVVERQKKGDYDISAYAWNSDNADPDNFLGLFTTDKIDSENPARYSNPEYDKLVKQGREETDASKRMEIYAKAQKIIYDDFPFVAISGGTLDFYYFNAKVKGLAYNPMSRRRYLGVEIAD